MSAASTFAAARVASTTSAVRSGEVAALAGEVAGEIALIAAENPDVGAAHEPRRYYN